LRAEGGTERVHSPQARLPCADQMADVCVRGGTLRGIFFLGSVGKYFSNQISVLKPKVQRS